MSGILIRIIIAVIACLLCFALIPPVARLIGLPLSSDLMLVLRICIGGIAVFYIIKGPRPPWLA